MINRVRIFILYCAGFLFLCLGIAGYFLPGLPGTIFLILAAGCFLRSNQRMYKWVTEHKLFGRSVKRFLETGAMPVRAKIISVGCIWIFSLISMLAPYHLVWFKAPVIMLALAGTWYIVSRPTSEKEDSPNDDV
ncbi:MAG: YbaN family protein [SAR202 cluster bacterium]|nr:YbaN family protein [SAR202 cluster bacterium]